jgi:8-oxo-dGTP pyrophosphatase MutT (NUDIX family)
MKKNPWKTLSSKVAYKNPYFSVSEHEVIRPGGEKGTYHVVRTNPAVFIVALTPKREIFLIGLHRYTTNKFSWEIPGGGAGKQKPLLAAKRELKEETGLVAKTWKKLGTFQSFNGLADEISHTFLATNLTQTTEHAQEEEGISVGKKVPFKKALKMIRLGEITDGQSIASIMQAALYMKLL